MTSDINRRAFLSGACCLAASPLVTPVSFAAMPGENRLVTIVLRGAMDGLALVQPYGDPALRLLRPKLALTPEDGLLDLDGFFGLHSGAADLMPLWKAGELGFVHATSTPYRAGRSHFDGQDMLESGGAAVKDERTGWLNRAIASIPRAADRRAIDVTTTAELILSGENPVDVWSTRARSRGFPPTSGTAKKEWTPSESMERTYTTVEFCPTWKCDNPPPSCALLTRHRGARSPTFT